LSPVDVVDDLSESPIHPIVDMVDDLFTDRYCRPSDPELWSRTLTGLG